MNKSPWIKVEDSLPCDNPDNICKIWEILVTNEVLVRNEDNSFFITNMQYSYKGWYWVDEDEYKITHWMPIPEIKED